MLEKDAGGEFIGGLAGLLARPFAGAAGSAAVRNKVISGLTTHINDPLEMLLHRVGAGKAVEGIARAAAVPVPKSWPLVGRLAEKTLKIPEGVPLIGGHGSIPYLPTPAARKTWAADKAKNIINTVAQHPDAAAFSTATTLMAPIPGITEAYLGAKGLATKGLNKAAPSGPPSRPALINPTHHEWLDRLTPTSVDSSPLPQAPRPPDKGLAKGSPAPLPAEPTYLKWPPPATKVGAAYFAGRDAALVRFALRLV
jgi:hypothetical protein